MGLRHHRDDGSGSLRFSMREKALSIGDDLWVEDHDGRKVYKVNGKALRVRDTWVLEDVAGREVAKIRERKIAVRNSVTIHVGDTEAVVKKALIGIRDRFHVEVDLGHDLKIHGNVVDHAYEIRSDHDTVAEVSKKWFRMRDTYGVEVHPGADPILMLCITVAIDAMAHD